MTTTTDSEPQVGQERGDDQPSPEEQAAALDAAVNGLRRGTPLASASTPFVPWQTRTAIGLLVVLVGCMILWTSQTIVILCLTATAFYLISMLDRVILFVRGLDERTIMRVSDADALAWTDDELPVYTVLVPAYGEPAVIAQLLKALRQLDYPRDKLEVLLLLEADDDATVAAARTAGLGDVVRLLLVPAADPRTKPKACNYGLQFATGTYVTIYDAEDLPEPLQLRRAAVLFDRNPGIDCLQAKLAFHNSRQNLLTGWFTAEYGFWFSYLLPGLAASSSPIPLGGTSNHLRASSLREVGGWDPFNVTEDADLGVRLARLGRRTAVLDSTTFEEANSDAINWVRQRSRWYKGYLQTWLVATRTPLLTLRELGPIGFARMTLLLAGTPIAACVNAIFWFLTVLWLLGQPAFIAEAFPPYVYYGALVSIVLGNVLALYSNLIGARANGDYYLLIPCLTGFLYWGLMAIAALKGGWQLINNPSYWEKTVHGLDGEDAHESAAQHDTAQQNPQIPAGQTPAGAPPKPPGPAGPLQPAS
ncbi:MAG TPA: glycosyltransferase [Actinopolymorphaceae bacterium]|jgi:cellulose synthase/poly-beta-1,6-N-acetylglucosamine synthase-like glycosyltransferase